MKPEIKAKWVAALRSGKYQQGSGSLRDVQERFCCLGVLCDIKDAGEWRFESDLCRYRHSGSFFLPERLVREWSDFDKNNLGDFEIPSVQIDGVNRALHDHNDAGKTFAQIANAIEEQL